jgi:histidinol phosphatase-like enzyme (inositol monophosphatase family)
MKETDELKRFCESLAIESGKIIKRYWRNNFSVETKKDLSPVTIADKKAEELMREMIMKNFPQHGILGEEFGEHNSGAEYKWVLDPIDGTKSFVCGTVTFGTLIALLKNGEPLLGVINQPVLNEFLIGDNETALLNGKKVNTKGCGSISEAVLLTTDQLNIEKYRNIDAFNRLVHQVKLYRHWGDCYGYYLVATGYADIMLDPIMNPWDLLALIPVIRGAGGTITDYFGGDPVKGDSIVATGGGIHQDVIDLLNRS